MDVKDNVWSSDIQYLVTALMPLKVIERRLSVLEHRAHGAVSYNHSSLKRIQ